MHRSLRHGSTAALVPVGALLAACVLLGAACTSDAGFEERPTTTTRPGGSAGGITGTWQLESYDDGGGRTPAAPQPATLSVVADGTFSGSTGCNSLSGTYRIDGERLTVSPGPMTKRACIDEAGDAQERAVVAGLTDAAGFRLDGDVWTVTDRSGRPTLVWRRGPDGLAGTSWTVSGVNTGNAVESSASTGDLNATFAADGTVSGSGGCNTFSGRYTDDDGTLAVTGLQSTEIGCDPARATLESQYLAALGRATTYELTPTALTLRDGNGAIQVMFVASP